MKRLFTHMLIPKNSAGFPPWLGGMCLFGQPVPGPEVLVKSTSNGVATHVDGNHIIKKSELNQF